MNKIDLENKTNVLFGRDFLSELDGSNEISAEKEKEYDLLAKELYENFEWEDIFKCWNNYLHEKCLSERDCMNFVHLFWTYEGYKHAIPNPYEFLSYFYWKIDVDRNWELIRDLLDGMAIEILHTAGVPNVYYDENPHYSPNEDPKMIKEIAKWKEKAHK